MEGYIFLWKVYGGYYGGFNYILIGLWKVWIVYLFFSKKVNLFYFNF